MKRIMNYLKTSLLAGLITLSSFFTKANAQQYQYHNIIVRDPIVHAFIDSTQSGLSNFYVILKDSLFNTVDTFYTNNQGYVTLQARIAPQTRIINISQGWNMLSLPLHLQDSLKSNVFPSASTPAYIFDNSNGYQIQDTLKTKQGFWLRFNNNEQIILQGEPINNDTVDVAQGWNLIGVLSNERLTNLVTSIPSNIMTSYFYGFNLQQGYTRKDTLIPGNAYWIRVNNSGKLILNHSGFRGNKGVNDQGYNLEQRVNQDVHKLEQMWVDRDASLFVITNKRKFYKLENYNENMGIKNLARIGALTSSLFLNSLFNNLQAQQILQGTVRDPIVHAFIDSTQSGLSNFYVRLRDSLTNQEYNTLTNSQGQFFINVTSVKEQENKNSNFKIFRLGNGVNFSNVDGEIKIYNSLGQEVKTLNAFGNAYWDLDNNENIKVADGLYIYQIFKREPGDGRGDKGKNLIANGKLINLNRVNIGHTINNLESRVSSNSNKTLSKANTNNRIQQSKRFRLEIRDELTPYIGEFYDIIDEQDSLQNFKGTSMNYYGTAPQGVYEMIYNFQIDLADSFLNYFKRTLGTSINNKGDQIANSWLKRDKLPLKVYYNRAQAPLPVFNQGLDDALNEIEDSTQINYRGYNLPRLNLFQEVPNFITIGGINMNYSGTIDRTGFGFYDGIDGMPRGPPAYGTVYINRNYTDLGGIISANTHEFGVHAKFGKIGEPNPVEPSYPQLMRRTKAMIQETALSDFYNLSKVVQE